MALQLNQTEKGIECNYWKILRAESNFILSRTILVLGLYKDSSTRKLSAKNYLLKENKVVDGVGMTRVQLYPKIKESDMQLNIRTGKEEEMNKFVDATDLLDINL